MIILTHSAYIINMRRASVFSPIFIYYVGFAFVFIYQSSVYGDYVAFWNGEEAISETYFAAFISLLFLILGYHTPAGALMARLPAKIIPRPSISRLSALAIMFCALGLFGWILRFSGAGGFNEWTSVARGAGVISNGYLNALPNLLPIGLAILMVSARMYGSEMRQSIVFAAALFLLVWYFYTGSRSLTSLWTANIAACWYVPKNRSPNIILALLGIAALVLVANYLAIYRGYHKGLQVAVPDMSVSGVVSDVLNHTLQGAESAPARGMDLNIVVNTVRLIPEQIEYQPGALREFSTRPIPRSIWPEKPSPFYQSMTPIFQASGASENWQLVGSNLILTGPSFVHVGFWYAIGGYVGLFFGGLIVGSVFRFYDEFNARVERTPVTIFLFLTGITVGFTEAMSTSLFWLFVVPIQVVPILLLGFLSMSSSKNQIQSRTSAR